MKAFFLVLLCSACAVCAYGQDCRSVLGKQSPDAASLRKVEDRWDEAFMRGGTHYLECLLTPDYASVSPVGAHDRAWEIQHAANNRGSTTPIPEVPGMQFEVHGSTGVMRLFKPASADGKQPAQYMADIFAFQDGAWRAVYSQHTPVPSGMR
jgi:hypothetical protein